MSSLALGLVGGLLAQQLPTSAASTRQAATLARVFRVRLPGAADGYPVALQGVATSRGKRELLYLTTTDGHILALDAHTGATIWSHQNGPGRCGVNNSTSPCYTTSSPALDPNKQYVYSYGLDGRVHKYTTGSGNEVTGGGWPEVTTIKGFDEKGSSALVVATARDGTSYLYAANGGYPGDRGDYQGHLTTINLKTGSQHVFNTTCSTQAVHFAEQPRKPDCPHVQTAIWARPAAVYAPDTDRIYVTTGNGDFLPGQHAWGDSVLALNPDGTGRNGDPLDTYTPPNFQDLQDRDADLGSSAPVVLPALKTGPHRHLALQTGKDTFLHLLDLDNLNGRHRLGATGGDVAPPIGIPQGGVVLSQPVAWVGPDGTTWVFISTPSGTSAVKLVVDNPGPHLQPVWKTSLTGFTPALSRGILYIAGSGTLWALDPASGRVLGQAGGLGGMHWQSPVVSGVLVYIADSEQQFSAFRAMQR